MRIWTRVNIVQRQVCEKSSTLKWMMAIIKLVLKLETASRWKLNLYLWNAQKTLSLFILEQFFFLQSCAQLTNWWCAIRDSWIHCNNITTHMWVVVDDDHHHHRYSRRNLAHTHKKEQTKFYRTFLWKMVGRFLQNKFVQISWLNHVRDVCECDRKKCQHNSQSKHKSIISKARDK